MAKYKAAILITSDTCHIDPAKDSSGSYIQEQLQKLTYLQFDSKIIVPDVRALIIKEIKLLVDKPVQLIITSGGTGLCPRDVTPDACDSLYDKTCPGIAIALMNKGLQNSPHAALSRLTAGIIRQTLVVNFPGKLKACHECFEFLELILEHALEQIIFDQAAILKTHKKQDILEGGIVPAIIARIGEEPRQDTCHSGQFTNHARKDGQSIESSYELVDYEKAMEILELQSSSSLYGRQRTFLRSDGNLVKALGQVLAEDLRCSTSSPSFPASMMDGYVLNVSDWVSSKVKSIRTIYATTVANLQEFESMQELEDTRDSFFCYQVNTGGRIPRRNFAIIPFENTSVMRPNGTIPIHKIEVGKYIREAGSDLSENHVLERGTECGPIELGIMISMNLDSFYSLKAPLIGILSTGDEIRSAFITPSTCSDEGIIDVNNPMLRCLFKKNGLDSISLGIVEDQPERLEVSIAHSLHMCDILIITGGASMGTRDYVKGIIDKRLNGVIQFGRVNMKPGKPAAYATIEGYRSRHIFSLPGNPVSAYMTSLLLVLPFIKFCKMKYLNGNNKIDLLDRIDILGTRVDVEIGAVLDIASGGQAYEFDGRLEFVRAKVLQQIASDDRHRLVSVSAKQHSSRLLSLAGCDCLILVEPSMRGLRFEVGQKYKAILVDSLH